ncbi:MAG: TonB-dependent receptor [Pseudomonadales bacterium]|nr:TonB-dependent receptor [Pseudomonadales bacterium]
MKNAGLWAAVVGGLFVGNVWAESAKQLEDIEVRGVQDRLMDAGLVSDVIQKTELITDQEIEKKQAASLADAIANEPGIRVSAECSMCGVKRVMINGMKGEHTTVLIDGVPTHTMLSGFYGVDAVGTAGVSRVEVARGAGASLIAPEAIGGTINVVTKRATKNGVTVDASAGENGYRKYSIVGTGVSKNGKTRATLMSQYDNRDQEDADDNGVNEAPMLETYNHTIFLSHDVSDYSSFDIRVNKGRSIVFGGPMLGKKTSSISAATAGGNESASEDLFEGGNVNNEFTGEGWETTEHIITDREEWVFKWLSEINDDTSYQVTLAHTDHIQDSYYEGIDYYADDSSNYLDLRFNHILSDKHTLTVGVDTRDEEMNSRSEALQDVPLYISDSFEYTTRGLYLQDVWTPSDSLEISMALRIDDVEADFTDPDMDGVEINETMVSPRLHMLYNHSQDWVSRVAIGKGYRAPLSFFETDHGLLDGEVGYLVEVDDLEKSNSVSYALSRDTDRATFTASIAWSEVENLAFIDETDVDIDTNGDDIVDETVSVPTLSQLDEKGEVITTDVVFGYQVTRAWLLGASVEHFDYDDVFKSSFGIAPVEERVRLTADYESESWNLFASLTWIGARDLSEYGYDGFYDEWDGTTASEEKGTDAPSYYTIDMRLTKQLDPTFKVYVGVNNLLDYTQAGDEQSPLVYDAEGGYDVGYIYGPSRGRTVFTGVQATF